MYVLVRSVLSAWTDYSQRWLDPGVWDLRQAAVRTQRNG